MKHKQLLLLPVALLLVTVVGQGQKFRKDDPIWEDQDRKPIPQPVYIKDLSAYADFLENTFGNKPKKPVPRAVNINTLGEVPDSSWFTNRMSQRTMTNPELVRGPDSREGPDTSQPWVIKSSKTQGITPGFTVVDAKGVTYRIKFDPKGYPQLATSAEVICTKFFYAFGYYVPEYYLSRTRRENVKIRSDATITDESGVKRKMTEDDIDRIFEKVPVAEDGTVQVIASLDLQGTPVGPFKYSGTRSDDPNDVFPHENRRELRGLRLFAAWLNHDDSRSINTLDFYMKQGDSGYVRHHLIDFGSCLGSGSVRIQGRRAGNEYMLEAGPILKAALTLGLWDRSWRYINYPDYPSIGRFEADYFRPERWRPEYPNPAFQRMQNEDAFWACRIIARFSDEMVRAIVKTGQLKDRAAEEYLTQTLIKRRDKILRYYLAEMNPLTDFDLSPQGDRSVVQFSNLGEACRLGKADSYQYQWSSFDNRTGAMKPLGSQEVVASPEIPVPRGQENGYLALVIHAISKAHSNWAKPLTVYLTPSPRRIVGIERE